MSLAQATLLAFVVALAAPSTKAVAQCNCGGGDTAEWQTSYISSDDLPSTEVRQFVAFGAPLALYAATGGWMDQTAPKGSAKIIRLDSADGQWKQEVDFGGVGTTTGGLAALHFTQSQNSTPVDVWTLVAATWSGANAYARNEADGKWYKYSFGSGQIRAFGVHKDAVANETFVFAGGKPGIFRGQLADSRPAGKNPIAWSSIELNTVNMNLPYCSGGGRITGFAEARGHLFAAACWRVFERTDGPIGNCKGPDEVKVGAACEPRWKRFWDDPLAGQGESGLRGMTQIMHNGQQVLLIGSEVANAHVTRLDPDTGQSVVEFNVDQFLDSLWGVNSGYKIIPYNSPMPLWYGADGVGRRIMGFESWLPGAPTKGMARKLVNIDDGSPQQMLGEGMFFVRNSPTNYQLVAIPATVTPQPMTAIRDCIASPFATECDAKGQDCMLYCGGFDANKSMTQTPCTAAPCTFPPLVAKLTHGTGFIVKGRIVIQGASGAAAATEPNAANVPGRKAGDQNDQ